MRIDGGYILLLATIGAAGGILIGWKLRGFKVSELSEKHGVATYRESQIVQQAQATISELHKDIESARGQTQSIEERLNSTKNHNSQLVQKVQELERASDGLRTTNKNLHELHTRAISKIKEECALLPSVVEWSDYLQELVDSEISNSLIRKERPAIKAAEEVREARASARNWKRQADSLRNRVALYEAEAPWLTEYLDYSVEEIVEGLRQEEELRDAAATGNDPSRLFVSTEEWGRLSEAGRNQLALDRYWEYRQRNAWAAGIQYERYVGYTYEKSGFCVDYRGAVLGVNDAGIDLVCTKGGLIHVVQCKRLSVEKGRPVRENVIAQLYGASLYYAHVNGDDRTNVIPVVITTYELSPEAREFASVLGVRYREHNPIERYPCIKCNVSTSNDEKIYHLPFDQKYDVTRIEPEKGERYALTVAEAEQCGFRRAFRWRG